MLSWTLLSDNALLPGNFKAMKEIIETAYILLHQMLLKQTRKFQVPFSKKRENIASWYANMYLFTLAFSTIKKLNSDIYCFTNESFKELKNVGLTLVWNG